MATSDSASDDVIEAACAAEGVPAFRGSLTDVLSRYCGAERTFGPADHVVRLTADCPVADWRVIDACIGSHLESGADYTSNSVDRTMPEGLDVEVMKASVLRLTGEEACDPYDREHVTPFIYRNPDRFRLNHFTTSPNRAHLRWTVDTPADFELIDHFYRELYERNPDFSTEDILALVERRPELVMFNQAESPNAVS